MKVILYSCFPFFFVFVEEAVSYTLGYSSTYNTEGNCGDTGRTLGLSTVFSATQIRNIPYREIVEVPLYIKTTTACLNYIGVE